MAPRATRHIPVVVFKKQHNLIFPDKVTKKQFSSISIRFSEKQYQTDFEIPPNAAYTGYVYLEVLFWLDEQPQCISSFTVHCPNCWSPRMYLETLCWTICFNGKVQLFYSWTSEGIKCLSMNYVDSQFPFEDDVGFRRQLHRTDDLHIEGGEECCYRVVCKQKTITHWDLFRFMKDEKQCMQLRTTKYNTVLGFPLDYHNSPHQVSTEFDGIKIDTSINNNLSQDQPNNSSQATRIKTPYSKQPSWEEIDV